MLVTPPAHALSAGAADSLARYLDGLGAFGFTGQVTVSEADSVLAERALGRADGRATPVTLTTGFAVGSVTKSFTAALIVHLAHEHRLSLDDSLARLLPGVPTDKAAITPRQLLAHRSGLPEDAEGVFELDSRDQVLRATLRARLVSAPGERFVYSNAGFQLLAAIAERVSGAPWPRLCDSLLLAPAQMRQSGAGSAYARERREAATGRDEWHVSGSFRDWRQPWAGSGAGDLVTTAHDLWRWGRSMQGSGTLGSAELDTLLTRRSQVNAEVFYGFGLWLLPREGASDLVLIGGDIPGYHAGLWVERDSMRRIIAITNAGERWGRRLPVAAVQRAIARVLQGRRVELPPETVQWPADRLDALTGTWQLAPSGRLTLVRDGAGLRMQLSGAEAMNLVLGSDSSGTRALVEGRAADLLRAAAAHDDSALAHALLPVERGWVRALRGILAAHEQAHGPLIDAALEGSAALPWLDRGLRTYVTLHSKRGDSQMSFAWLAGGLIDVAADDARPAPVILPVAPLAEGGLGAWDLLDGTRVALTPFADAKGRGLRLSGQGQVFVGRPAKR